MDGSPAREILAKFSLACVSIFSVFCCSAAETPDALYRGFQNPPAEYSIMPYWYWNGRVNPADTRREMEAMMRQGVHRAIVFPWDGMEQRFLSKE